MNTCRLISSAILLVTISVGLAPAQQRRNLGENAALRYWSAFAQLQDAGITEEQAKELTTILDGTAPYDDSKYKDLVERNRPALETMARATTLPNCDWGVDYQLGTEAPVEYVRKALVLGRVNVLYTFHLLTAGDKDGAVRVLAAGLRFSRDAANGGSLFATVVAKRLLVQHLRAAEFALRVASLSAAQRLVLQNAVAQLGPDGLDWQSAIKQELGIPLNLSSQASAVLTRIMPTYLNILNNASELPLLEKMIASAPPPLRDIIPSPKRVLEEKHDLIDKLLQARSQLR
jgi:hypothetical protein